MVLSHAKIETNTAILLVLALLTVVIGGIVEIIPLYTIETTIERVESNFRKPAAAVALMANWPAFQPP